MPRRLPIALIVIAAAVGTGMWYLRSDHAPLHYTGFVEGEERVIRSEVAGRVLEVKFAEGAYVPADAVIAVLDDSDIQARLRSKREEVGVIDAEVQMQQERIELVQGTWQRDLNARTAELRQSESALEIAERTLVREQALVKTGASTAQVLDDNRSRVDQARSARDRARELLARVQAEERTIAVARHELTTFQQKRDLALAQANELQVTLAKCTVHAPAVPTIGQTQFIWPGEFAQPGSALFALLDPTDKYVQIYVPVSDVSRISLGQRVAIELDSRPGQRTPGEVRFIADTANFTPEKIETRSDRMGQVYRVKIRILEGVEQFQPGTEGNVYLSAPAA
jgi:HlyD family secretion protein